MAVAIRLARSTDMPALGRLGAQLVSLHHYFDPQRFIAATPTTHLAYTSFLEGQLQRSNVFVLVAEEGGTVLSYAYAGIEGNDYMLLRGPAGVLYDIVVEPSRRREGIGRKLLDAVTLLLNNRGVPRLVLMTAERNHAAQRLFAAAGFRRTMIEMTRELDPLAARR
jgi:ribosomal protein S18 acetylase RimI-like enzyme